MKLSVAGDRFGSDGDEARDDFAARIMQLPEGTGARRETTAQRDARERGDKRFNPYGVQK